MFRSSSCCRMVPVQGKAVVFDDRIECLFVFRLIFKHEGICCVLCMGGRLGVWAGVNVSVTSFCTLLDVLYQTMYYTSIRLANTISVSVLDSGLHNYIVVPLSGLRPTLISVTIEKNHLNRSLYSPTGPQWPLNCFFGEYARKSEDKLLLLLDFEFLLFAGKSKPIYACPTARLPSCLPVRPPARLPDVNTLEWLLREQSVFVVGSLVSVVHNTDGSILIDLSL